MIAASQVQACRTGPHAAVAYLGDDAVFLPAGLPGRSGCLRKGVRQRSPAGCCRIAVILTAVVTSQTPSASAQPVVGEALRTSEVLASIGTAAMLANGTVVLQLRAAGPNAVGDALLRYPPSHPDDRAIRIHLPGLKPGKSVPVPPFD